VLLRLDERSKASEDPNHDVDEASS